MNPHTADNLQLVLLYDDPVAFQQGFADLGALATRLSSALSKEAQLQVLPKFCGADMLTMSDVQDRWHFSVQRYDTAMPQEGFASVFQNWVLQKAKAPLLEAIRHHQNALLVTVGAGGVPGFAQALAQSSLLGALGDTQLPIDFSQDALEARMVFAQKLGHALILNAMPSCVQWGPSQNILDGATFMKTAEQGFSLDLYMTPFLFGGDEMPDGAVALGVRAFGSQYLLGKMVIFRPNPQPWVDSYMATRVFVAHCRSLGRILGEHETMSHDGKDAKVIRVAHKNDEPQLPNGYIELHLDPVTPVQRDPNRSIYADPAHLDAAMRGKRNLVSGSMGSCADMAPAAARATAADNQPPQPAPDFAATGGTRAAVRRRSKAPRMVLGCGLLLFAYALNSYLTMLGTGG